MDVEATTELCNLLYYVRDIRKYPDGVPCSHPGCLHHIYQRCEGCGRVGGYYQPPFKRKDK